MPNRFIATILAATLALTAFAAVPARAADNGEIARLIFGAGALFMLGHALTKNNKNGHVIRRYEDPVYQDYPRRHVVPSACMRVNKSGHGPRRYFGRHCLNKNMRHAGRLPNGCLSNIWTNRGQRTVYSARCLRNNGWIFG